MHGGIRAILQNSFLLHNAFPGSYPGNVRLPPILGDR